MTMAETTIDSPAMALPWATRRTGVAGLRNLLSGLLLVLATVLGIAAFLYPFWAPALARVGTSTQEMAHAADAPLVLAGIVLLCFAVLLVEVQTQAVSTKAIALLGVLVALNSVLRFAEVAIPGPGGFSPIFLLIIAGGYIFGARIGFLLGTLTIVVSALVTGGVGPWMPYQMLAAGWVGMAAPLCRPVVRAAAALLLPIFPRLSPAAVETAVLGIYGAVWGILFGVVMNVWFWPYAAGPAAMSWQPGEGAWAAIRSYALFYLVTSLVWDLLRAAGNLLLLGLVGAAVLRILRRFQRRFDFAYLPLPVPAPLPRPHLESISSASAAPRLAPAVLPAGQE